MPDMMHLKFRNYCGSWKIFSMCKIDNVDGGAKLPLAPLPPSPWDYI